jgi:hypothetical protein
MLGEYQKIPNMLLAENNSKNQRKERQTRIWDWVSKGATPMYYWQIKGKNAGVYFNKKIILVALTYRRQLFFRKRSSAPY